MSCGISSVGCYNYLNLWVLVIILPNAVHCTGTLSLTSQPQTSGTYCPGPVTFTCVGTEINNLFWIVNGSISASYGFSDAHTFPFPLLLTCPLSGVTAVITIASMNPIDEFDITSDFRVNDISILNGASLQCGESVEESGIINIAVDSSLTTPPSPSTSCSLLPSPGGAEVSLQWSPSFTSQHAVERYRVSVNPDPSSCSSEQVSPSEDYSCSGLVLGTLHTFTVSAINCGDQEGDTNTFTVLLESLMEPANLQVIETGGGQSYTVQWRRSSLVSEGCSTVGGVSSVDYIVTSVDSAGNILDQEVVTSDSCNNSLCSTSISVADICGVEVLATSLFGNSSSVSVNIGTVGVRLTTANQVLLATGVVLLCIALVIAVILIIMAVVKRASRFLVVVGCVLILISALLWVGVAGLQNETCGSTTRNNLIIAAHVFSDVTFLVLVVSVSFSLSFQCCKDSCIKLRRKAAENKACYCLCHWLAPPSKSTRHSNPMREGWEIQLEDEGESALQKGEGGRRPVLEAPRVLVDEFKVVGETTTKGIARADEEVRDNYEAKLKEAQRDPTQHHQTLPVTTPTQTPTEVYAEPQQGEHSRGNDSHEKEDKHYLPLLHKTGGDIVAMITKPFTKAPTDTYAELDEHNRGQDSLKKEDTHYRGLEHKTGGGTGPPSKPVNPLSAEYGKLDSRGPPSSAPPPPARDKPSAPSNITSSAPPPSARDKPSAPRVRGSNGASSTPVDSGATNQVASDKNAEKKLNTALYKTYAKLAPQGKLALVLDEEDESQDKPLEKIADSIGDWDSNFASAFGLTPEEIRTVEKGKGRPNVINKWRAVLKIWRKKQGSGATYGNLLRIFLANERMLCASVTAKLWDN